MGTSRRGSRRESVDVKSLAWCMVVAGMIITAPEIGAGKNDFLGSVADQESQKRKASATLQERNYEWMTSAGYWAWTHSAAGKSAAATAGVQTFVIGSEDVLVDDGVQPVAVQSETSIAANANATILIAGYNDGRGFDTQDLGTSMTLSGVARSTDGGATWEELKGVHPAGVGLLPNLGGGIVAGDPDVKYDPVHDRFVYSSIFVRPSDGEQGLCLHISSADGGTWTGPIEVTPSFVANGAADKEFMDINPATGRILLTWSHFPNSGSVQIRAAHSDDGGLNWVGPTTLSSEPAPGSVHFSVPRFGPGTTNENSKAYTAWEILTVDGQRNVGFARSLDGGTTWDLPTSVTTSFTGEDQILGVDRVNSTPSMAVDRSNGNIYVVYPRSGATGTADIAFQRSTDGGQIFSEAILLNSDPGNDRAQFFPWVAVDPSNGRVHVMWYDQGYDASGDVLEVMQTLSRDGGVTWSPPTPVNDRPFHAGYGNDSSQPNLGDYIQGVAFNGQFFSAWAATSVAPSFDEGQPKNSLLTPDTYFDSRPDTDTVAPVRLQSTSFDETSCPTANGNLDPGESANLTLVLDNYVANPLVGAATQTSVTATLSTTTPLVTVLQPLSSYPDLPPLSPLSNLTSFAIQLDPAFVAGTYIDLLLAVNTTQGSTQLPIRLVTGSPGTVTTLIDENFEQVAPPALPVGWSWVHGGGSIFFAAPWITSNAMGGSVAAFHPESGTTGLKFERLFSPVVTLPDPGPGVPTYVTLDFDLTYNLEDEPTRSVLAYDGLTVRINDRTPGNTVRSVLAEAFAEILKTGTMNHFPKHLPRSSSSAYFEDMSVWSGNSGGPVHIFMKFPGAGMNGKTIQVRFEYTEDDSGVAAGTKGVAVDNVVLRHIVSANGSCAAGSLGPGWMLR
ncbi:MAG: sialidase family protein [bacterium]